MSINRLIQPINRLIELINTQSTGGNIGVGK